MDLSFYFAVFLRRLHYFIIIAALVAAAAIAAAFLLPPTYWAQARLLVESSQIPDPLAPPQVKMAALEQLQVIENRLMTRANLLDVARRLNVSKDLAKMTPDEIVQMMRDHTKITKLAGKDQATIMTLEFTGENGQIAAGVVNEYVTLILKENAALRTARAEDTLEFFQQEVKSLGVELDKKAAEILDFQNKNADAMPNTLQFRMTQQAQLQGQLSMLDQNIAQLQDQRQRLVTVFQTTGQVTSASNNAPQTPEARQLAQLRDQLNASTAVLSPENPKVKLLQAQITQLEAIVRGQLATTSTAPSTDPAQSMLDVQLADIDSRIALAQKQRDQVDEQLKAVTDTIERTPANQIALDALTRDQANIQNQYNQAVSRLSSAATGERIEILSKGERIVVLDAATVPTEPASPNRLLIALGGIGGGILLGLATVVLIEVLNRSVRRPKDLIKAFGITPFATIPYMRTPSEAVQRRTGFAALLLLAVAGIPALIYAVHVYYQPLDIILAKVASKLGIRL